MAARVLLLNYLDQKLLPFVPVTDLAEKDNDQLISSRGVQNVKEELMLLIEEIFQ